MTSMYREIFSLDYHLHFFPALLWNRLRRRGGDGTTFVRMEYSLVFVFCCILAITGIPNALAHHSVLGWVVGGAGVAGIVAMAVFSIRSWTGPPSYDNFLTGVFFFLLVLGFTAGVFAGALEHSLLIGLLGSIAGLVTGYLLGIFAGLVVQYLGWLAVWVNLVAGLGVIGLIVLDLVLLLG